MHSEFWDGNVAANYEQVRVFQEALEHLAEGVEKVYLRADPGHGAIAAFDRSVGLLSSVD